MPKMGKAFNGMTPLSTEGTQQLNLNSFVYIGKYDVFSFFNNTGHVGPVCNLL